MASKVEQSALPPNCHDYLQRYLDFDWQYARVQIRGYADGINMAYEAIERHVEDGYKDQIIFIFLGEIKPNRDLFIWTNARAVRPFC